MALDFLTSGTPAASNTNQASSTTLPDWYNAYIQGLAAKGADVASTPYQAYPGQRLADFNDDQMKSFQQVRDMQGSWQPTLDKATGALTQAQTGLGAVPGFGTAATSAVSGPAQGWTDAGTAAKYMSPYTQSVVDEIGRLGNRNLMENIIPNVESNFVGSGQFGSSRNADILGRAVRSAQDDITGQQSTALQAGYTGAMGQFNADAARAQQQEQLQATTNLGAGNLAVTGANAGTNVGGALGQVANQQQQQQVADATALGSIGGQQQQLEQTGFNTSYQDFLNQQGWDWSQLGKLQGLVSGAQLPTSTSASSSTAQTPAGTSPLQWLSALGGLYNSFNSGG